MPRFFTKVILSLLASFVVLFSFAPFFEARAQSTTATSSASWYNQGAIDFYQKVFDKSNNDIFGERYTYAQVSWITYSLVAVVLGGDIGEAIKNLQQTGNQNPTSYLQNQKVGGALGSMLGLISQFYASPPASGTYWLTQEVNRFSIVKTAYAASTQVNGFGFNSLTAFLPLWTASRNLAYTVMIIVTLMLAFAIMFRLKLNPQTAISVQNAIPKIAVTLILITFSYAIAGFVIDLMYLIFGILVYGIKQFGGLSIIPNLNPADLFNGFVNGSLWSKIWLQLTGALVAGVIAAIVAVLASAGTLIIPILGLLIAVVVFFAKTFIMLAQTYISLIINIVFAPIVLIAEAIPFVKLSAMGWFKSVVADVLVFLAVGILFLAYDLLDGTLVNSGGAAVWAAPYVGNDLNLIRFLLWVGVWSMLPNIRKVVYDAMEKRSADIALPREFAGQGESFQRAGSQYLSNEGIRERMGNWATQNRPSWWPAPKVK